MTKPPAHLPRLIEVDLPLRVISRESQREKSIRHGHLSTLHVWWARRPLAACRAVIAASLWVDPGSAEAPAAYRGAVLDALVGFATRAIAERPLFEMLGPDSLPRWRRLTEEKNLDGVALRESLLDLIALISSWDAVGNRDIEALVDRLTMASHRALGGDRSSSRPLVVDPFAGGGAMPLEALRVGADAFASDLNPVAVLLNRVALEYAPGCDDRFIAEVERWGAWVQDEAVRRLSALYPSDNDGAKPVAYLWARKIACEGPACGRMVPLVRSFWLTKRASGAVAVRLELPKRGKEPSFVVLESPKKGQVPASTVKKGSAVCPWPHCGHTTPVERVRAQLNEQRGGAADAVLIAVVTETATGARRYRSPTKADGRAIECAHTALSAIESKNANLFPTEILPPKGTLGFRVQAYGISRFRDLYSPRQLVALATVADLLRDVEAKASEPVAATLSLALGRLQDLNSSLSRWADTVVGANAGQNRLSMTWDFAEASPFAGAGGSWSGQVDWIKKVLEHLRAIPRRGSVAQSAAQTHPLPNDSATLLATDPPYYDAFGYADLSDLFLVWLKRATANPASRFPLLGPDGKTPKQLEIVVNRGAEADGRGPKDHAWFYSQMRLAFAEARRVVAPEGLGVIVFAHKDTKSWEALLAGVVEAGWVVTASWPIATERPSRQRALGSAALASSVHLVCRPREDEDGNVRQDLIGDWRAVLEELPRRIHAWLPRLAAEGIVGADALFACLGPGLEVFSRYSRVEKTSGEVVSLREYLEQVWAAVSREAIAMLFSGVEASELEPDARVTAMFLWTLHAADLPTSDATNDPPIDEDEDDEEEDELRPKGTLVLEYDAIRKIAQGLGANLEELSHVVAIKGEKAQLVSVSARVDQLFTKPRKAEATKERGKRKQMGLFEGDAAPSPEEEDLGDLGTPGAATTTLDRVHQAMLLFATGRTDALKRLLVVDGVGREKRFWTLAQTLSHIYPRSSDEKRWIDGVLARKKGLGF